MVVNRGSVINMGLKLLWTAVAISIVSPLLDVPAGGIVAAVLALIGIIMLWLDK